MKYRVLVVAEAEEDIFDIYRYVLRADGRDRADHVLQKLWETCQSLADMPRRGHSPPELENVGVHGYREVHFKPKGLFIRSWNGECSSIVCWMGDGPCRSFWSVVCSGSVDTNVCRNPARGGVRTVVYGYSIPRTSAIE